MVISPDHQAYKRPILQGTVQGSRKGGRQKKRWEDNIREWTELKLSQAMRTAEKQREVERAGQ